MSASDDHVGAFDVRIRATATRLEAVAAPARAAAVRVLERAGALLEARVPGRVLLVRELPLAIRIREPGLTDDAELEAVAVEIADALERSARTCGPPSPADELVVFASEARWHEAFRAAADEGERAAWYFAAIPKMHEPAGTPPLPSVTELVELESARAVETLLALVPREDLATLAGRVATAADAPAQVAIPGIDTAAFVSALGRISTLLREEIARRDPVSVPADRAGSALLASEDRGDSGPGPRAGEPTGLGGIFYLLGLVLELGLGELLWKACLPEGPTLGHALAALVEEEDAALTTIAGGALGPIGVSEEQREDVAHALFAATLEALPRHGFGRAPELHAALVPTPAGRFLVAGPVASPFVLSARPARDDADVPAALAALVAEAGGTAISASPALATIDPTGRVRARSTRMRPALFESSDPLLVQIAGSLSTLFSARAGIVDVTSPRELVERCFRLGGTIVRAEEEIRVLLDMRDVDVAVRRAGLDADPGWIPWLGSRVTLEFIER